MARKRIMSPKPKQEYSFAPEVEAVARPLINQYHQHLKSTGVKIVYLFCEVPEKKDGQDALAMAHKMGGLDAFLTGHYAKEATLFANDLNDDWSEWGGVEYFAIVVFRRAWQFSLSHRQKVAVVDHELSHCGTKETKDGTLKLVMIPHDLQDFAHIVKRHGCYLPDVAAFIKAAMEGPQLTFEQIAERDVDSDSAVGAVRDFASSIAKDPGLSSVTISAGGESVTLRGGSSQEGAA